MDEKAINNIREQIEFLKSDLNCSYPDSELGASKMVEAREATKLRILQLMDRLAGVDPAVDERQYYRQMLEKIASDRSALDMVQKAIEQLDDDDCKSDLIREAMEAYETTKRGIATKLMEKLN